MSLAADRVDEGSHDLWFLTTLDFGLRCPSAIVLVFLAPELTALVARSALLWLPCELAGNQLL